VLIVDDEPLARRGLKRELERIPGIVSAGECSTRDEAVAAIVAERPDVVLLDVQLGRNTAFEVIERIGVDAMPFVIFVTAYDRHALRAFEVHAVDYVLKPVDPDRLREALDRAARLIALEHGASLADRLERLLAARTASGDGAAAADRAAAASDRLVVHDGHHLAFVDVVAIDWIEACGNYVRLHVGAKSHLIRTTMNRIAERVGAGPDGAPAPGAFVRIRRSALVNPRAILSVERYAKGMFMLSLRGGAKLTSSRYHQAGLRRLLGLAQ
jgi:two-component system LytT family response regulator